MVTLRRTRNTRFNQEESEEELLSDIPDSFVEETLSEETSVVEEEEEEEDEEEDSNSEEEYSTLKEKENNERFKNKKNLKKRAKSPDEFIPSKRIRKKENLQDKEKKHSKFSENESSSSENEIPYNYKTDSEDDIKGNQDDTKDSEEDIETIENGQIDVIECRNLQLQRKHILQILQESYFNEYCIGLFIRISINNEILKNILKINTSDTKVPQYICGRIESVEYIPSNMEPYTIEKDIKCNKQFIVYIGTSSIPITFTNISNQVICQNEWENFLKWCKISKNSISLPNKREALHLRSKKESLRRELLRKEKDTLNIVEKDEKNEIKSSLNITNQSVEKQKLRAMIEKYENIKITKDFTEYDKNTIIKTLVDELNKLETLQKKVEYERKQRLGSGVLNVHNINTRARIQNKTTDLNTIKKSNNYFNQIFSSIKPISNILSDIVQNYPCDTVIDTIDDTITDDISLQRSYIQIPKDSTTANRFEFYESFNPDKYLEKFYEYSQYHIILRNGPLLPPYIDQRVLDTESDRVLIPQAEYITRFNENYIGDSVS